MWKHKYADHELPQFIRDAYTQNYYNSTLPYTFNVNTMFTLSLYLTTLGVYNIKLTHYKGFEFEMNLNKKQLERIRQLEKKTLEQNK